MRGPNLISLLMLTIVTALCAAETERPNVILVMADDIGIEGFGCYGGTSYSTPNIDQMAAEGQRFTHAYSQPLCTPTRVQIMTGKYNHRNWVCFGILDPAERTFGHLMKDAGYRTCIAGKWQLQSYDPPDFPNADKRRGLGMKVSDAGFEEYSLFHSWHTEDKGSRYADPTFDRNGKIQTVKGGYGPDTSVDFILDFLKRHREEPTFVYYPMALPHWPMVPTPDSESWEDPDRRLETGVENFPDMVAYMDKLMGRLVRGVDSLGLGERTLILFYSDNGTDIRITSRMQDESGIQGGKATPKQTGIRVPLIARWKGTIDPGRTDGSLVDASDFLPTLAELAQTKVPGNWPHDGQSFVPQLLGRAGPRREASFFWYDPRPGWDKERFRRHVFALDHDFKLFSDGRLFDIRGVGLREVELDLERLSPAALAARAKLKTLIEEKMNGDSSAAAQRLVDAFGLPVTKND